MSETEDVLVSDEPCIACGSTAGLRDGVCVVCACPQPDRQLAQAVERAKAFGPLVPIRQRNGRPHAA